MIRALNFLKENCIFLEYENSVANHFNTSIIQKYTSNVLGVHTQNENISFFLKQNGGHLAQLKEDDLTNYLILFVAINLIKEKYVFIKNMPAMPSDYTSAPELNCAQSVVYIEVLEKQKNTIYYADPFLKKCVVLGNEMHLDYAGRFLKNKLYDSVENTTPKETTTFLDFEVTDENLFDLKHDILNNQKPSIFEKRDIFYDFALMKINSIGLNSQIKFKLIQKIEVFEQNENLFSKDELIEQKKKIILKIKELENKKLQYLKTNIEF